MNRLLSILLLGWLVPYCVAQENPESAIEHFIAELIEDYSAESEEEPDAESWYDELMALADRPLNINKAEQQDLLQLPFLSELQVENILYHRYTYGAFTSLYELQLVEGLDMTDIRRMLPFINLGDAVALNDPIRWWEVKKFGRHELYLRSDFIPEIKKGYQSSKGETAAYNGDRLYSHLKYRFDFRDRIRLNITLEKDAGERWWNKESGGVDFSSASLQLRSIGPLDNLIVGDFTGGFGQGLVLRQGFNRTKSAQATRVFNAGNGFKRFASTNEYAFFRGIAASAYKGKYGLHAFASIRNQDATYEEDVFRSLYVTGYHRTPGERDKRDRVGQQTTGASLSFRGKMVELGWTTVFTHFSDDLNPELKPYNRYYLRGQGQLTSGVNYRLNWHGTQFFGETALAGGEAGASVGTVNGITLSPSSRVSLALVHRYYPVGFNPFFAASFSAQSRIGNEQGMYIGMEVLPARRWKLAAYADSYRFAWLKYGVDAPSSGNDFLLLVGYSPSRRIQISLRNRYRQQYASLRSENYPVTGIVSEEKWSSRLQLDYSPGTVQFRTVVEVNQVQKADGCFRGYAAWQDVTTPVTGLPLKLSFRYLMFQIPDYANRIYTYERDVLHAFASPSFSGTGSRYYLMANYIVNRRLALWLKMAQVNYSDGRLTTGSGNEEIEGSRRTEVHFLLRLQLRNQ